MLQLFAVHVAVQDVAGHFAAAAPDAYASRRTATIVAICFFDLLYLLTSGGGDCRSMYCTTSSTTVALFVLV